MNQRLLERVAALLPAVLLGIVAFTLVLIITDPPGPGLDPDALHYMGAAESVVAHLEYRVPVASWSSADSSAPLAHFPPGYSTVLAIPVRLGMAPPQAARLVEALAAGVTVSTLVLLVGSATTPLAGILLAVALFATAAMHEVHVSVLSEPLFLVCLALTLAAMTWSPDRPLRAGIPAALGALTRYAGVALVGAAVLWQLLQGAPLATRMRRAAIALLPALVLQGAWVLRTRQTVGSTSAIRHFALYGNIGPALRQGGATLRDWLVPDPDAWVGGGADPIPYRGWLALAAGVVLLALVLLGAREAWRVSRPSAERDNQQSTRVDAWRLLAACGVLLVCYLGMIVASRLVADANIPFDERILSPCLLLMMTMAATTLALWWRAARSALARVAVCGALLAWWAASASVTHDDAEYALDWGSDFAAHQWRSSEVLEWARTNGARHPLYTNWPAAVYFHLHRPSHEIPRRGDARALAAFPDTLRVRDGRVLAFTVAGEELAMPESLVGQRGLRVVATLRDGIVLAPAGIASRR
jgi:hypothetical protein